MCLVSIFSRGCFRRFMPEGERVAYSWHRFLRCPNASVKMWVQISHWWICVPLLLKFTELCNSTYFKISGKKFNPSYYGFTTTANDLNFQQKSWFIQREIKVVTNHCDVIYVLPTGYHPTWEQFCKINRTFKIMQNATTLSWANFQVDSVCPIVRIDNYWSLLVCQTYQAKLYTKKKRNSWW